MVQKIIEKLIQEYSKKTYEELLELPEHFQLTLPELEALNQTVEFVRVQYGKGILKIVFRHAYWENPQEMLKAYTQQYVLMRLTQKGAERKAVKTLEKVSKEGVDHSGKGLPKSAIAAMQQMKEEHPELAFPYFPPQYAPELIFNHASNLDGFLKKIDNTLITTQEEVNAMLMRESNVLEQADWFGKTGLSEEVERELPKYLRLEFGEMFEDEGSLKANDLNYLGVFELHKSDFQSPICIFDQNALSVYIWQIGVSKEYAYVEIFENGDHSMFIGDYLPQSAK